MNLKNEPQILLTNDDSIHSPGLWAAAEALSALGFVHVVAPREQNTSTGRSLPNTSDGIIQPQNLTVNGKNWTVYAVGGSPAQTVLHGVLEIIQRKPDLVVSGINYGENIASGITISGTVGAALEAATLGIPALAISLQTGLEDHFSLSKDVDFSTAAYFTHLFAKKLLKLKMPMDVDVLKVDVPSSATAETPWVITRQSRERYYHPKPSKRQSLEEPGRMGYDIRFDLDKPEEDSDLFAIMVKKLVSVTPLSFDLTSRVDMKELQNLLKK
ncbi:MAG: 5'/3'-nucleotidase SurE, partial [Chloroflexota bacterium]